ncbi:DUF2335 domain-containing protein [Streptomyces sp. NPDC001980]|uniref:DUF2335 domain-containing protein n=1 Tax=Streptomyces sp. NPDC001980 TaxID=3157126 RepID=UPI003324586B
MSMQDETPTGSAAPVESAGGPAGWRQLPVVEQAERWEQIIPGSAERMLAQVEREFDHRRRVEVLSLVFYAVSVTVGAFIGVGCLWLAKYFLDHGQAAAGAGLLGSGSVVATGLAVVRRSAGR